MKGEELIKFIEEGGWQYDDIENLITHLLYKHYLDFNEISRRYVDVLNRENAINKANFEEACSCLCGVLGGNFTKEEDKTNLMRKCVKTYNKSETLPTHIFDEAYRYTEEIKGNI